MLFIKYKMEYNDNINEQPSIDWRTKGAVTPIKNGGSIDIKYSWVFAVTGMTEGYNSIITEQLHSLSEQQLIDCASNINNSIPIINGLNYTKRVGLETESTYPYTGQKGSCKFNQMNNTYKIPNYNIISQPSFCNIYDMLKKGPIIVEIPLYKDFMEYKNGIYTHKTFHDTFEKYYLLIVGFSIESNIPYFICKASLGTVFGINGYIYINANEKCFFNKIYFASEKSNMSLNSFWLSLLSKQNKNY
jgi:hypothetical protein